jgi:hypothetical protein
MAVEKRNIFLYNTTDKLPFSSPRLAFPKIKIPNRPDPDGHGNYLKQKIEKIYKQNQTLIQPSVSAIRYKGGIYLEFSGKENYDLIVKSLENIREGIRLVNVHADKANNIIKATVYIPEGKETYFINKINQYLNKKTRTAKPRNNDLINSIDNVSLALLEAFWFGDKKEIPDEIPVWCEIWLRADNNAYEKVQSLFTLVCEQLSIDLDNKIIYFPERVVRLIRANSNQLKGLINNYEYIGELHRAPELASFFDELQPNEQNEWVRDLIDRLKLNFTNSSICLLDTGVNYGHPLLNMAFESNSAYSVEPSWGEGDIQGHGTKMAGIALYYDLQEKLFSNQAYSLVHHLESAKILSTISNNRPQLYGNITQQAIYHAETAHPEYKRTACMAVTSGQQYNTKDGSPTSWSGAVDSLTYGADDGEKRLMIISAGNVNPQEFVDNEYPNPNFLHSVENPGQAWNAITVGAYNKNVRIDDDQLLSYNPVADNYQLSPYSSTSSTWDKKWPIKPEILCNGGNLATDGENLTDCVDLSLLTTHSKPFDRLFSTINGTSAATAQAAWLAAQITSEYPDIWPETVRALLVHSARWTDNMKKQFLNNDKKTSGRRNLLRVCGYGIPDLDRAIQCKKNSVNLIVEGEIQPFTQKGMNEMHIHKIPWPKEILQELGEIAAEMRVTLSYFIDPGPGEIGWKDKYRYPSCNLRFDVINQNENITDFKKRINMKMREDKFDSGEGSSGSRYWYLGSDNRDVGSIHSDFREQNAVELCEANYVAVYPVTGWWRERKHLKCYNKKIRYSLIVTISTPEVRVDLYTPIITQIKVQQQIPIDIIKSNRNAIGVRPTHLT